MPLAIHIFIHFSVALLTGYICGRIFKDVYLGILAGLIGGFFIDLDHVLEYFLVFGANFNLQYFLESRQFLVSDKIRLLFHAWEYVPLLFLLAWAFIKHKKTKIFLITLAFAGFTHLISDVLINNYHPRHYSLIYRYQKDFQAEKILSTDNYQLNLKYKKILGI